MCDGLLWNNKLEQWQWKINGGAGLSGEFERRKKDPRE